VRWAFAVLLMAGCDHLLQLVDIHPVDAGTDAIMDAPDAAIDGIDAPPSDICFADPFSGTALDTNAWTPYSASSSPPTPTMKVNNGVLEIDLFAGPPSTTLAYNGVDSVAAYPVTKGWVEVELVQVPNDPLAEVQLYAIIDMGREYLVAITAATMTLYVRVSGSPDVTASHSFNAVTDHYLRIRDGNDGNVYVDTATTEPMWTTRIKLPAPIPFDHVTVGLASGTDPNGITTNMTTKLDNVAVHSPSCLH
jgi:hypothetical protein